MTDVGVRLLGAVAVERDGVPETRRSRNHAALLALLALNAGEAVDGDVLIDQAWGEDLPRNPRGALQVALTRLRAWLGERTRPWITAAGGLYTLHVERDAVDLLRFHRLADAALRSDDVTKHEAAHAAWRGTPFPGLDSERLAEYRRAAEQRHRALTVHHATLLLAAGRAGEAVDLLVGEDRLDEGLAALLVRALRDDGRHRAAVDTYLDVRRRLRDELDAEPGEELRALYASLDASRPTRARPRAPELVGRDDVRGTILDALHDEGGRLVVVRGRAGAGKSAVLRAVAQDAHARGARAAASAWGESGAPAAPWHEALADLGVRGAVPDRDLGLWTHDRLCHLARDAPLLVVLDDAHRADSASLAVLRTVIRRGLPSGVVLVLAARSPDTVEHPHWDAALRDLVVQESVTTTDLAPLTADAVGVLVAQRLAHLRPDHALADAVVARSGGLALHLAALLGLLARCRTLDEAARALTEVPHQVRAVIEHQATALPDPTRRAIEAVAVLHPIDLAGLAVVLGQRPLDVADDLDVAARAGLVSGELDRYVLRHDLDADGLRAAVPPVRAAHLHLARLDALDDDADVFTVLRHAEGATTVLAAARVARARVAAGVESYRRRALPEALTLLDAALPAVADEDRPRLLTFRALSAQALGATEGDPDGALDAALDTALEARDDELALLVAIGDEPLGLSIQGDARRLARLHRLDGRPLSPRQRLDLLAATIREAGAAQEDVVALVAQARGLADSVATDDQETRARVRALEARALVDQPVPALDRLAVATDAHRLAFASEDPSLHLDGLELLMTAELAVGHTERAHTLCQELATTAERWFRPRAIWAARVAEASMLLAEGDPGADAAAGRAAELALPSAAVAAGAHLLVSRLLAGRVSELGDLAAHASAQSRNTAAWAAAAALAEVCAGHDDEARAHLAEYVRRAATGRMWFTRAAAAMAAGAACGLGEAAVASHVREVLPADPDAAVLVGFGGAVLGPVTLWTGLAAWTLGDEATARDDWSAAFAFADRAGWRPWSAAVRQCLVALEEPAGALPFGFPHTDVPH